MLSFFYFLVETVFSFFFFLNPTFSSSKASFLFFLNSLFSKFPPQSDASGEEENAPSYPRSLSWRTGTPLVLVLPITNQLTLYRQPIGACDSRYLLIRQCNQLPVLQTGLMSQLSNARPRAASRADTGVGKWGAISTLLYITEEKGNDNFSTIYRALQSTQSQGKLWS